MAAKTNVQVTFTSEAEFEKAVLKRLNEVLPGAIHEAVHACMPQVSTPIPQAVAKTWVEFLTAKGLKIEEVAPEGKDYDKLIKEFRAQAVPAPVQQNTSTTLRKDPGGKVAVVISQPKEGSKCRAVWDELDKVLTTGEEVTLATATKIAQDKGWNVNNARAEFYRWKTFRASNPLERRQADRRVSTRKHRGKERRVSAERRVTH